MKTTSHILLIIIVCFITVIANAKTTSVHNAMAFGNASLEPSNIFRILVSRDLWTDESVIAFFPQALDSYENYDSEKMFAPDNNYPQTYTLTSDNVIVAINGESILSADTERIIPLGFHTDIAGTFTFTATNMISFDPSITVYLEDVQENVLQDLRINNIYEFTSGIASNASRFRLHYIKTANAVLTAGSILTTGQTICYNSDPSVIGNSTVASGGDGSITYQWQSSIDVAFTVPITIGSSNSATYDPPAGLTVNTWYRRQANDGTGNTSFISSTGVWAVTVNPNLPVSVSVAANPGTTMCPGTSVTFTAIATNGGTTPTYQWKRNGNNISGATNSTYTSIALANGDLITCVLTSNAACAIGSPATSNTLTMTVAYLPVSISIAASPNTTVCPGTSVTFTATPINGGTAPIYQWKINGTNIGGAINSTYTCIAITSYNGKKITCEMTSSEACVIGSPATSNTLKMSVNQSPKNTIIPEKGEDSISDDASYITGLSNESIGNDISIYPNPTTSSITLDYSGYQVSGNYELKIYSIEGKLISFTNLNNKTTIIDVDSYDTGIYYIRFQSKNGVLIRKFIKE